MQIVKSLQQIIVKNAEIVQYFLTTSLQHKKSMI